MAGDGSAVRPLEIDDSDDEKMDTSQAPPPRPKEPETIDLCSDDDASKDEHTDEEDEAGGALDQREHVAVPHLRVGRSDGTRTARARWGVRLAVTNRPERTTGQRRAAGTSRARSELGAE